MFYGRTGLKWSKDEEKELRAAYEHIPNLQSALDIAFIQYFNALIDPELLDRHMFERGDMVGLMLKGSLGIQEDPHTLGSVTNADHYVTRYLKKILFQLELGHQENPHPDHNATDWMQMWIQLLQDNAGDQDRYNASIRIIARTLREAEQRTILEAQMGIILRREFPYQRPEPRV